MLAQDNSSKNTFASMKYTEKKGTDSNGLQLVGELLERYGYRVEVTKKTHDGDYDIFACKTDTLGVTTPIIVECKRYREDRTVRFAQGDV